MAKLKVHSQIKTEQDVRDLIAGILDKKTNHMFSSGKLVMQVSKCLEGSQVWMSLLRVILLVDEILRDYVKQDKFVQIDDVYASGEYKKMLLKGGSENVM